MVGTSVIRDFVEEFHFQMLAGDVQAFERMCILIFVSFSLKLGGVRVNLSGLMMGK
jgi:hypothetical protein